MKTEQTEKTEGFGGAERTEKKRIPRPRKVSRGPRQAGQAHGRQEARQPQRKQELIKTDGSRQLPAVSAQAADKKVGAKRTAPRGKKEENTSQAKVKIIPLGGLEQIGMNITAFECEDSIVIVDCGLAGDRSGNTGCHLSGAEHRQSQGVCDYPRTRRPYRRSAVYFKEDQCAGVRDKIDDRTD